MTTEVKFRLRFGLLALATAVSKAMYSMAEESAIETAKINVTKPYKPRRLKLDPIHQMARRLYKMRARNPNFVRKRKLIDKVYRRKNKMDLKRRSTFVKKARDRMGLDKREH